MAYIGPQPKLGRNREVDDISSGFNGSATTFTLQVSSEAVNPGTANDIVVSLGGVIQNPNQDYTIAGSTITFTTAPISGLSFFAVVLGQSVDSSVVTPPDGSVSATKLASPLDLPDNQQIRFGAGNDLTIQSDGTNALLLSDLLLIKNAANNETLMSAAANGSIELYEDNVKKFETAPGGVALTGGAAANIATVPSSSNTVTLDMATACHFVIGAGTPVVLGENTTFAAPTNQAVGQAGSIFIKQDSTGSRTVAFNTAFKFVGGTVPTMSTAGGAVDRIDYIVFASGEIHCAVSLDVKR
jgi:hypothetical protein